MSESPKRQTFALVVAWIWVGLPLAWGVLQVIRKSFDLFR
jgi:hypothetical protein